jgi:hypothetical protein
MQLKSYAETDVLYMGGGYNNKPWRITFFLVQSQISDSYMRTMSKHNLIWGQKTLAPRNDIICEPVVKLLFGSDSKEGPKSILFQNASKQTPYIWLEERKVDFSL